MMNVNKYTKGYFMPPTVDMSWTQKEYVDKAPTWCSVDLRDGNQSLIIPMSLEEKIEFYKRLVEIGFKEIEVGFPAASETEFEFLRTLVEQDLIPDDVTVQVLTQAREHIIKRTFEALKGVKNAIVHVYNSTSVAQRQQVFRKSKEEIKQIAIDGAKLLKDLTEQAGANYRFEYSPESFTGTEPEFALEVCNAVLDVWQPTSDRKAIINLPATVQMSMPHVYASQIAYISQNLKYRENVVLSLHPHNDRGTGVADSEMGLLAGADRIEGTLFGNGERTGNADIITIAMNMFALGVDPKLDFSNMPEIIEMYERVTRMHVYERQPYAGKLVFAAFSGSHQDAIAKGMKWREENDEPHWTVPYLLIDPQDVGRQYDADVIRINSQSGKGGVAYVMESMYGFHLPKGLQVDFSKIIQDISEEEGEVSPERVYDTFIEQYVDIEEPYRFVKQRLIDISDEDSVYERRAEITIEVNGEIKELTGLGNGPIDAVKNALNSLPGQYSHLLDYSEHALTSGSSSKAAAYVYLRAKGSAKQEYGVGIHPNITTATIKAIISAMNRLHRALK